MRDTEILEELEAPDAAQGTEPLPADLEPFAPRMAGATDVPAAGLPVWLQVERDLVARGWAVTARLLWVVEARRDHGSEQALGMTRNEAYARLGEVVRLDEETARALIEKKSPAESRAPPGWNPGRGRRDAPGICTGVSLQHSCQVGEVSADRRWLARSAGRAGPCKLLRRSLQEVHARGL